LTLTVYIEVHTISRVTEAILPDYKSV